MKQISTSIRTITDDQFDILGDKELYDCIVADMISFSGDLRPALNWDLAIGGKNGGDYFSNKDNIKDVSIDPCDYDEIYERNFSTMSKMVDPWIGCVGLKSITKSDYHKYFSYLSLIDHLNLLQGYFHKDGSPRDTTKQLMVTDLGSMIDVTLISNYIGSKKKKIKILEVGAGYGRLAEIFLNIFGKDQVGYVLLDAVPASLMYAYKYLAANFPELNIGCYYNDDPFDLSYYHCYVMPSWHFNEINSYEYDVCVNIQSMQEMSQVHVDYYLKLFDSVLKKTNGLVYLSNEKDYIFQGEWNYPESWNCVFKHRTPRSWTRDSPTEIYLKGNTIDSAMLKTIEFIYSKQLSDFDDDIVLKEEVERLEEKILLLERSKMQSEDRVIQLENKLDQLMVSLKNDKEAKDKEIKDLHNKVLTEQSQRERSDTDLMNRINGELKTRKAVDDDIIDRLRSEHENRSDSFNKLSLKYNASFSKYDELIDELKVQISTEKSDHFNDLADHIGKVRGAIESLKAELEEEKLLRDKQIDEIDITTVETRMAIDDIVERFENSFISRLKSLIDK